MAARARFTELAVSPSSCSDARKKISSSAPGSPLTRVPASPTKRAYRFRSLLYPSMVLREAPFDRQVVEILVDQLMHVVFLT